MSQSITSLITNNHREEYIIEDDIDFYSELNKSDDDEDDEKNEVLSAAVNKTCLITGKLLEPNSITLDCKHSFNYISLFKELCRQKTFNINDPAPLKINETKCPYCRQITGNILPYIPTIVDRLVRGVNMPSAYCMMLKPCDYIFRQGTNKGEKCNKNGFESIYGNICEKHYFQKETSAKKMLNKKDDISSETLETLGIKLHDDNIHEWTSEMQDLYDSSTITEIRKKLKEKNLPVTGNKKIIIQRLLQ